jgi:hypothetical protein
MKKFRILMGVAALVVVAATVVACNKEKESDSPINGSEIETVSKDDDMSAYLKKFKEKMQSPGKSEEMLSTEDARWHLEAILNYTYCDAGYPTSEIYYDTLFFKLNAAEEEVSLGQLNDAFCSISNDLERVYGNCDFLDKSVLAVQTIFDNESRGNEIVIKSVVCIRGNTIINMGFDSTDYWNEIYCDYGDGYIDAGGKCGDYCGEGSGSGAPLELTRKLNMRIPSRFCENGSYFTDIEGVNVNAINQIDDFIFDENSPCHYKVYYRTEDPHYPWASNPGGCICPEDMNYYLSKGLELINHYKPEGKVVVSVYYQSDHIMSGMDDNCFHDMYIVYGIHHCNNINDY